MNEREFQDKLADYLAGELTAAEAEAFRAALATDENRRRLVDELQAAAAALECHDVSEKIGRAATADLRFADIAARVGGADTLSIADRSSLMTDGPVSRPILFRGLGVIHLAVRYAAVIVLAFVAGYWFRGGGDEGASRIARPHTEPIVAPAAGSDLALVDMEDAVDSVNERYVAKYAKATRTFPNASSFSRTLMVLANSSK